MDIAIETLGRVSGETNLGDIKKMTRVVLGGDDRYNADEIFERLLGAGFFRDPASTRFHGSWEGGLAQHSLRVLYYTILLYPTMCPDTDTDDLVLAALLHDLCKVQSYEISQRNVKKNGVWVQEPFYQVKDHANLGHGAESIRRIPVLLGFQLNDAWTHAVRWHMGVHDISEMDKYAMAASCRKYPEVLCLQTADQLAGVRDNI